MTATDACPEPATACDEDMNAGLSPRDDRTMTKHDIS